MVRFVRVARTTALTGLLAISALVLAAPPAAAHGLGGVQPTRSPSASGSAW
ncbi:MAG: hypothetical protein WD598_00145 [Acidimicrobiia bacterium]